MTLFGLCKTMAELTADMFIIPILRFQRNLFPPFSYPAGDLADWFSSEGGIVTLAWIYAVNIAFAVGMTNLIIVIPRSNYFRCDSPIRDFWEFKDIAKNITFNLI